MTAAGPSARAADVAVGPWYPELPPRLAGEDDASYQARLVAGGVFDHDRAGECAAGQHTQCRSCPGQGCDCPHHFDDAPGFASVAAPARPPLIAGARQVTSQLGLPEITGLRLMTLAREVARGGRRLPAEPFRARIASAYGSPVSGQFTAAVTAIYRAAVMDGMQ